MQERHKKVYRQAAPLPAHYLSDNASRCAWLAFGFVGASGGLRCPSQTDRAGDDDDDDARLRCHFHFHPSLSAGSRSPFDRLGESQTRTRGAHVERKNRHRCC